MDYHHVINWRRAFLLLQVVALVSFVMVYALRSEPAPKATRYLPAGQVLTAADLVSDRGEVLLGKALRAPVSRGERITSEMVMDAALPPAAPSATLAGVISVAQPIADQRRLVPGAKVLIRRQSLPDIPAAVVSRTCHQQVCVVAVALEQLPVAEKLDLQSFATADLIPTPATTPKP